MRRGDFKGTKA